MRFFRAQGTETRRTDAIRLLFPLLELRFKNEAFAWNRRPGRFTTSMVAIVGDFELQEAYVVSVNEDGGAKRRGHK